MAMNSSAALSRWVEEGDGEALVLADDGGGCTGTAEGPAVDGVAAHRSRSERSRSIGPLKDFEEPVGDNGMIDDASRKGLR